MYRKAMTWETELTEWKDIEIISDPTMDGVKPAGKTPYYWFAFLLSSKPPLIEWIKMFNKLVRAWQETGKGTQVKVDGTLLKVLCDVDKKGKLKYYKRELKENIIPSTNRRYKAYLESMSARERSEKHHDLEARERIKKMLEEL